jgi:hypothetical protein
MSAPNNNPLQESVDRQAAFDARVAAMSAAEAAPPAEVVPRDVDVEFVRAARAHPGSDGRPRIFADSNVRAVIDRANSHLFQYGALTEDLKREVDKVLGRPIAAPAPAPAPAPTPPAAPPATTPDDPRILALEDRLSKGELLSPVEIAAVAPDALGGYDLSELPAEYGLNSEHIEMLQVAKAAGIPQEVVSSYIRALRS